MKRSPLWLAIDRDGLTEHDEGGIRLYGPKYNGSSKAVGTCLIDQYRADSMREYLDRYFPRENTAEDTGQDPR